ncbi:MAG: hypothetical protein R2873_36705 [Caldilineaceae bacterium]|nr:hypothetical protein [Caldilineaceae bacterium]
MAGREYDDLSWLESKEDIITLENRSRNNYILDLPTGLYRLDSGRRMHTLRSILKIAQVQKLIDAGELVIGDK